MVTFDFDIQSAANSWDLMGHLRKNKTKTKKYSFKKVFQN